MFLHHMDQIWVLHFFCALCGAKENRLSTLQEISDFQVLKEHGKMSVDANCQDVIAFGEYLRKKKQFLKKVTYNKFTHSWSMRWDNYWLHLTLLNQAD